MWKYFKWGAKNHPGNGMYLMVFVGLWAAAFMNKDILSGVIAASVATLFFIILYWFTSIAVGKANKNLVDEEHTQPNHSENE